MAVAAAVLGSGVLWGAVSHADKAVLIPGAMPLKQINPLYPTVAATYPGIGEHFHHDAHPQLIVYSQNPLATESALAEGVSETTAAILGTDGKVVVVGESMGSMVAWRAAEELQRNGGPRPDDISFVLIAPPEVGVAEYFKEGTYIPIVNYRVRRIAATDYDTTIVVGEYDGWADPPDRPWNLVSSANALMGISYVHGPPIFTADVSGLTPEVSESGKLKTYFVPTKNLPLTQPFRDVGVPDELVDKADDVLRPVVDAGYVRHDKPGDTRPYLRNGEIRRNVQSQQQARESLRSLSAPPSAPGAQARERHREVRQAIRGELRGLRDRVAAGLGELTKRLAGPQADSGEADGD